MRIIRHSPTGGRITEFVKEDRARVNIKVNPSLQYMDGIELAASIDDTTTAIVYLRWVNQHHIGELDSSRSSSPYVLRHHKQPLPSRLSTAAILC